MKHKLTNVRLTFPALHTPEAVAGEGKPAFSACFLIAKTDPQIAAINATIAAVAASKWGEKKAPEMITLLTAQDKVCLHDGSLKTQYEGFDDALYISARSSTRPLVIDTDKSALVEADGRPYSGCYVHASVDVWAQDNSYGKRINAQLQGVQFLRDGDSFGGGVPASMDDFDDVSVLAESGDTAGLF